MKTTRVHSVNQNFVLMTIASHSFLKSSFKTTKERENISMKRIEELEQEIVKLEEEKVLSSQFSILLFHHHLIASL
jgi:hypothetical protein